MQGSNIVPAAEAALIKEMWSLETLDDNQATLHFQDIEDMEVEEGMVEEEEGTEVDYFYNPNSTLYDILTYNICIRNNSLRPLPVGNHTYDGDKAIFPVKLFR